MEKWFRPVVVLVNAGSFDCVRLAPHFAQDDRWVESGLRLDRGNRMFGNSLSKVELQDSDGTRWSDAIAASWLYGYIGCTRGAAVVAAAQRTDQAIARIEVHGITVGFGQGSLPDTPAGFAEDIQLTTCG